MLDIISDPRWRTAGRSVRENTGSPSTSSVTIIDQVRSIKSTSACILHCVCTSVVSLVEIFIFVLLMRLNNLLKKTISNIIQYL